MTCDISGFLRGIIQLIDTQDKREKETGSQFNIFRILGMERAEVATHSSFLREMLDPLGSHGMGDIFLDLFLCTLNISDEIDCKSVIVEAEKYIGPINETFTKGGRIDLFFVDKNEQKIFVENKIDADDQKNQLLRYHTYDEKAYLVYLTLNGHEPSELSKGSKEFSYILMSYSVEVLDWLEECKKVSATKPVVREAILDTIFRSLSITG